MTRVKVVFAEAANKKFSQSFVTEMFRIKLRGPFSLLLYP